MSKAKTVSNPPARPGDPTRTGARTKGLTEKQKQGRKAVPAWPEERQEFARPAESPSEPIQT